MLLLIEISSIKCFLIIIKKSHCVVLFEIKGQNKLIFLKYKLHIPQNMKMWFYNRNSILIEYQNTKSQFAICLIVYWMQFDIKYNNEICASIYLLNLVLILM